MVEISSGSLTKTRSKILDDPSWRSNALRETVKHHEIIQHLLARVSVAQHSLPIDIWTIKIT